MIKYIIGGFIVICIICVAIYLIFFRKPIIAEEEIPQSRLEEPPVAKEEPTIIKEKPPSDAKCRGEIKNDYYTFSKASYLGKDIVDGLHLNNIEKFALDVGTSADRSKLILSKYYYIGKRNTSNTQIPPLYGGTTSCVEYPDIVYKVV
jgi:hypothetical protein